MINNKRLLIVSYYANMPGACQAEWLDDKIKSLHESRYTVIVVSAICTIPYKHPMIKHVRVPSLSLHDFKDEMSRCRDLNLKLSWYVYPLIPMIYVFGLIIDFVQIKATDGVGEGRWSWVVTSFLASIFALLVYKADRILSTGGPASAHVSSILVSKIFRKPVVVELQDPLSGGDIGRNVAARGWLYKIEKFIIRNATKIVYVTRAAAEYAKEQFRSPKINAVYPGAWDFKISRGKCQKFESKKIRLVHLGSLYATRTFEGIISAIEMLIDKEIIQISEVELLNLGHVAPDIRKEILQKKYVKILPPVAREEALKVAANSDIMLLIQNKDERSHVTIPYKTYDYLNLNNRVLGLLNNDELKEMLKNAGKMACDLDDINDISQCLESVILEGSDNETNHVYINSIVQAEKLISLNY